MEPVKFFKTFWDIMEIAKAKNKGVVFKTGNEWRGRGRQWSRQWIS